MTAVHGFDTPRQRGVTIPEQLLSRFNQSKTLKLIQTNKTMLTLEPLCSTDNTPLSLYINTFIHYKTDHFMLF